MVLQDFIIIAKKILVGILVFLIPLLIFLGGLWFVQHALK
jgi:hypothetical protein